MTATSVSHSLPFVATNQEFDVWDALGDPTRRAIVTTLARGPLAVGDLASELPVTRPAVSQHLKVLKGAGLVDDERAGTRRVYSLNAAGVIALRDQLDTFWNRAMSGFEETIEKPRREKK